MIAWSRLPMVRSGSRISAIFASTALSPSALSARGPRRVAAFSSWTRSFIAPRSSSVNPLNVLPIATVLLADFCVAFVPGFLLAIVFADLLRAALSRGPGRYGSQPASYFRRRAWSLRDGRQLDLAQPCGPVRAVHHAPAGTPGSRPATRGPLSSAWSILAGVGCAVHAGGRSPVDAPVHLANQRTSRPFRSDVANSERSVSTRPSGRQQGARQGVLTSAFGRGLTSARNSGRKTRPASSTRRSLIH